MGEVIEFNMQAPQVKQIVEAALLAAGRPLSLEQLGDRDAVNAADVGVRAAPVSIHVPMKLSA